MMLPENELLGALKNQVMLCVFLVKHRFRVTLGKPELVQIDYNDVSVDMTAFNVGNIAKFSLPLAP